MHLEFLPKLTLVELFSIIHAESVNTKPSMATILLRSSHLTKFNPILLRSQQVDHVGRSQISVPSLQQEHMHSGLELRTLGMSINRSYSCKLSLIVLLHPLQDMICVARIRQPVATNQTRRMRGSDDF